MGKHTKMSFPSNAPSMKAKMATQDYVDFSGGPAPKNIKPDVQMPSVRPKTSTPAQKGGLKEDLGKC